MLNIPTLAKRYSCIVVISWDRKTLNSPGAPRKEHDTTHCSMEARRQLNIFIKGFFLLQIFLYILQVFSSWERESKWILLVVQSPL